METRHIKHPFEAVIDENSKVLILGTIPSVRSASEGFYYMHPQNRFWDVLGALFGCDLKGASKDEKIKILLQNRVALYDIIEECDILGSSDGHIRNIVPADIPALIKNSKIHKIFADGKKAFDTILRFYKELKPVTYLLPSTSPANAKMRLKDLIEKWKTVLEATV